MNPKLKMPGATRSDGKRLCDTCRSSTIIKGAAESAEVVYCGVVSAVLPFKVVDCNDYDDKASISLRQMGQSAWVLETDKSGRKIGFVSPDRWKQENKHSNPTDDVSWD